MLLFGYIVAVAIQVVTRAISYDGQAPFDESLLMISQNQNLYLTSMYSGLMANFLLVALAAGLYSTFAVHQVQLARVGACLLLAAAVISLGSSAAGLAVARLAQEFSAEGGGGLAGAQGVELLREALGRTGFTLAALGVITLGALMAWSGTLPRWLGWLGIAAGISMFFIWVEAATTIHRLGGAGYLLWLAIVGGVLVVRGTQHESVGA